MANNNNDIPRDMADRMPQSAMPPLPEYEEGSLSANKADIMEQVRSEINPEGTLPKATYTHKADVLGNAFYMDDIIAVQEEEKPEIEDSSEEIASLLEKDEKKSSKGLRAWIETHRAACLTVGLFTIVLVGVLLAVWLNARNSQLNPKGGAVSLDNASANGVASANTAAAEEDPLVLNEEEDLNTLINSYFKARQEQDIDTYSSLRSYTDSLEQAKLEAKSEYIEGYRNIKCYTKKGPYDNSYMVYVSYDLKLKDWDQTVPALETLVVCREEGTAEDVPGRLFVYSGSFDDEVVDYIQNVTAQDDVVDLFKRVDSEYQEIMDADPDYEEYMASLKQLIRDGVGVRLAAVADDKSGEEDTVSGDEAGQNTDGEEEDQQGSVSQQQAEPVKPVEFEVEATTYVNVRASDSEQADRVGSVGPGTKLTCKEQLANGWSHVIYEGNDAYIKSEYLTVVGEELKVKGKVNVISTVNIRAEADINSDLLGVAYAGTTYDMIEDEKDGWTQIVYNGKKAFIKSEYLEVQ